MTRETFTLNRELEYFWEPELTKQIEHHRDLWPLVLLKELIDNSLDNCEEHGILPHIIVTIDENTVTVTGR